MTRGHRAGFVTAAVLTQRLDGFIEDHHRSTGVRLVRPPRLPASHLLGHARFHGLVTDAEFEETRPRKETTIACYMSSHVGHLPAGASDALERYVQAASRIFYRGGLIANLVAVRVLGDAVGAEGQAPRFSEAAALALGGGRLQSLLLEDAKQSTFKHVFLPERWPTQQQLDALEADAKRKRKRDASQPTPRRSTNPRNADVDAVLTQHGDALPTPPDWQGVMSAVGWDNVINRMASKYVGNLKVAVTCGLKRRVKAYVERWVGLSDGYDEEVHAENTERRQSLTKVRRETLADVTTGRLRPLAVSNDDYEMVLELRKVLGVSTQRPPWLPPDDGDAESMPSFLTLPPPKRPEWSGTTLAAHLFLVKHGGGDDAYLPIVARGRKFCYVDAKIAVPLLGLRPPPRTPESATPSLGDLIGLTPERFTERCKALRRDVRSRLRRQLRATRSAKRRRLLREKARHRLGSGRMPRDGRVDSIETDGVGLRICVKVPTCMRSLVVPLPTREDTEAAATAKERKRGAKRTRPDDAASSSDHPHVGGETSPQEVAATLCMPCPCCFAALDTGRAKLFTAAIFKPKLPTREAKEAGAAPDYSEPPPTVTLTRHRYYRSMGYFRHRQWAREQQRRPGVAAALSALAAAGGVRRSRLEDLLGALAVERAHEDVLDAEYVERKDYAVWKMRLFRGKRRTLDGALSSLLKACVEGAPSDMPLIIGIGSASFPATGRGELSVPTTSLERSLKRRIDQLRRQPGGRRVDMLRVGEFRTTMCCCACRAVTQAPLVVRRDKNGVAQMGDDGRPRMRRSRRLRLCANCAETAAERRRRPARDRDVQGARNILWATVHQHYGAPRPEYLCRPKRPSP